MLTASLQSTWEQKNRQQSRQKYGSYQAGYGGGEEGGIDMNRSIAYGSQERNFGKSNNYSVQQAQQNSYYPNSNTSGSTAEPLPNLKMPQMGGNRANMGLTAGSLPSGQGTGQPGSSGPSPRGGAPGGHQYAGPSGGAGSGGAYGNMGTGGLSGGNSLYLGGQQQQQQQMMLQSSAAAQRDQNAMNLLGGMQAKKHRASSRQSNHKNGRRGQHRYVESPNYNPPHGAAGGADQSMGVGNNGKYMAPQAAGGGGQQMQLGPGGLMSYQQTAPSPTSTLLMSAGQGGEGAGGQHQYSHQSGLGHAHHNGQQQNQHPGSHVLPQIGGSGGAGGGSTLLASGVHQPPLSAAKHGSGNLRSQYLSQMNSNSPPSPTLPHSHLASTGTVPAFNLTTAPVVREFQQGNVLTVTEEHGHSGVTSIRGMKPGNPNWINQDNFFVTENFDGRDIRIYCVLDGHGEHGHLVSRRCREMFPQFIKSARMDIDSAFNMMQNDLVAASDMDVRCSGATCVMATLFGGRLAVYNCGDSRAVLGRRNPNGSIYAVALSKDHKPDKAEERKRILSCGGHLGCRQVLVNQPGRGPVSMPVGPCRVWYQHRGETLGLAMSRSLGDSIVHKSGVSAEPECIDRVVDDYDEFFILATDGVWDVVDNNYAVQLVQSFAAKSANWSPIEAASSICRFARSRWEKLSPMIDDISCIVVKVHR